MRGATLAGRETRRARRPVVLAWTLALLGCGDVHRGDGAVLELLDPALQRLGRLSPDGTHKAYWTIRNAGNRPLQITSVQRSCMCVDATWPRILGVGERGRIAVEIRVAPGRPLREALVVETNEGRREPLVLMIEAFGDAPLVVSLEKSEIHLGEVGLGETVRTQVAIRVAGTGEVENATISLVRVLGEGLAVDSVGLDTSDVSRYGPIREIRGWITLHYTPRRYERSFLGEVVCEFAVPGRTVRSGLKVAARVLHPYVVTPESFYAGTIKSGDTVPCRFVVTRRDGAPFTLVQPRETGSGRPVVRPAADRTSYVVACTVGPIRGNGPFLESVRYRALTGPGEEAMEIRLQVAGVAQ